MPQLAFLFAGSFQDADDSAVIDWKWERNHSLQHEFIRPDNRQLVRYVPDMDGTMSNFRWMTPVYLGRNWERRRDALLIRSFIDEQFFRQEDPELPPPRPPRKNRVERLTSELRDMLSQIGGRAP